MRDKVTSPADAPLYPIREVSRLTGVNSVTLRAWERRYGLIKPRRTPKGHRLYARDDIERIERILQWLNRGVSVSQVRDLLEQPEDDATPAPIASDWSSQRQQLIRCVESLDLLQLDALFNQGLALYPVDMFLGELWLPAIAHLEEHWSARTESSLPRHALESFLRTRVGTRLYHANLSASGPPLMLAPLPDNTGPLWSLLFALAVSQAGYRVEWMDRGLPHGELPLAIERLRLAAVVLISGQAERGELIKRQLPRLAEQLSVPLCLAGAVSRIRTSDLEHSQVALLGDEPCQAVERMRQRLAEHG